MEIKINVKNINQTMELGEQLARFLPDGSTLLLVGARPGARPR